jgi:glyoxylase-like metal-dependent hydrolase (beta-lactamase superfamily II)
LVEGVEVLRTPGHTNDSISLYLPSINSVIVGDTLQGTNKGLKYPSIYENLEELIKSVEKIKSLKPSFVYVSHGKSGSIFLV